MPTIYQKSFINGTHTLALSLHNSLIIIMFYWKTLQQVITIRPTIPDKCQTIW
jgi:hypothetical protein